MKLAHLEVRGAGLSVHAWESDRGICALKLGEVDRAGITVGSHPVRGIEIAPPGATLRSLGDALERFLGGEAWEWHGALDERGVTSFQRTVFAVLREIPSGETRTYGQVAAQLGRPDAVRAVGGALRRNPFPIVVPCHRVVRSGGGLGGYSGGVAAKRQLLALEMGQRALKFEPDSPGSSG